jgi:hypothetical protein
MMLVYRNPVGRAVKQNGTAPDPPNRRILRQPIDEPASRRV